MIWRLLYSYIWHQAWSDLKFDWHCQWECLHMAFLSHVICTFSQSDGLRVVEFVSGDQGFQEQVFWGVGGGGEWKQHGFL